VQRFSRRKNCVNDTTELNHRAIVLPFHSRGVLRSGQIYKWAGSKGLGEIGGNARWFEAQIESANMKKLCTFCTALRNFVHSYDFAERPRECYVMQEKRSEPALAGLKINVPDKSSAEIFFLEDSKRARMRWSFTTLRRQPFRRRGRVAELFPLRKRGRKFAIRWVSRRKFCPWEPICQERPRAIP
jgi:hypothetical protein